MKMDSATDLSRIGEALSRPGIDPRTFVSLAIVTKVTVEETGVICDVTLLPSGVPESATVAPLYGGDGFGMYAPIDVDQMVVVGVPDGDPNHGLRIMASTWDGGERPPRDVTDHPSDFILVVKDGKSCRIRTSGSGSVLLMSETAVEVRSANGTAEEMLKGRTYRAGEDARFAAMDTTLVDIVTVLTTLLAAIPTLTGSPAQVTAYTDAMTALNLQAAAFTAAIAAFNAGAPSYLARIGKVE